MRSSKPEMKHRLPELLLQLPEVKNQLPEVTVLFPVRIKLLFEFPISARAEEWATREINRLPEGSFLLPGIMLWLPMRRVDYPEERGGSLSFVLLLVERSRENPSL